MSKDTITKDETQELQDLFKGIGLSENEISDILQKAETIEVDDKEAIEKAEAEKVKKEAEEKYNTLQKAIVEQVKELNELKKSLGEVVEPAKEEVKPAKVEEKSIEKAEDNELQKSITKQEELIKGLKDEISGLKDSSTKIDDLSKSINDITEGLKTMSETVQKIASTPVGMKSHTHHTFIEKGGFEAEDGSRKVHITDKETILKGLENLIEKAVDPHKKESYEQALISFNSNPDGAITKGIAVDLQKSEGFEVIA